jgi:hypothetical protein
MSKAIWTTAFPNQMSKKREPRRRVKSMSHKQRQQLKRYAEQRTVFLQKNRWCAVYPSKRATEVHHCRGRIGGLLLNERYWLAVSSAGHHWIHSHPTLAKLNGWLAEKGEWGKQ